MKNRKILIGSIAASLAGIVIAAAIAGFYLLREMPSQARVIMPLKTAVAALEKDGGTYLTDDIAGFHAAIYAARQPEIVVTGSAQVLAFKQEDFNVPFANLGGMATLDKAISETTQLFDKLPPKIVMIAIDPRWFATPTVSGCDDILCAARKTDGFEADGSYNAKSLWQGRNREVADIKFQRTIATLKAPPQNTAAEQKLADWISGLKTKNINVILMLMPLPQDVRYKVELKEFSATLDKIAKAQSIPFYEFNDEFSNLYRCEFSSGLSAGVTLTKRLLLAIATQNQQLLDKVKLAEVGFYIKHAEGKASSGGNEVEFLELYPSGPQDRCHKPWGTTVILEVPGKTIIYKTHP